MVPQLTSCFLPQNTYYDYKKCGNDDKGVIKAFINDSQFSDSMETEFVLMYVCCSQCLLFILLIKCMLAGMFIVCNVWCFILLIKYMLVGMFEQGGGILFEHKCTFAQEHLFVDLLYLRFSDSVVWNPHCSTLHVFIRNYFRPNVDTFSGFP